MKRLLIAVVLCAGAVAAQADPGDIEARAYTTLAPKPVEDWGAGIAIEAGTLPDDWPLIGGRAVFGDVVYLGDAAILGASISLRPMEQDDGFRLFGAVWMEEGAKWAAGLSRVVATW